MQLNHTTIYCVMFGLIWSGITGVLVQVCESVNDCPCGSVCVSDATEEPCRNGVGCTCKKGCFVFNTFLEAGEPFTRVHGNLCSCLDPVVSKGLAACTLMPWDNTVPPGVEVTVDNENCNRQATTGKK